MDTLATRIAQRRREILIGVLLLAVLFLALYRLESLQDWWRLNSLTLRQSLVSGLLIGGVYSLVAMGLTLIFGVLGIINFAHGALMVIGMYITYFAFKLAGIDPYVSLVISIPVLFVIGALLQRQVIHQVMNAPAHNQLLLTVGLALFMENLFLVFFTADPLGVQVSYGGSRFFVEGTMVSLPRVYAFIAGLVLGGLLYLMLTRTDLGKSIRAAAQDREGASLSGINVERINMLTFGLGSAAAGAAGSLIMPFFTVSPTTGDTFNIPAFVVVVLGGMGNVPGAMVGGLLIGLTEGLGAVFLPGSSKQLGVFVVFIFLLLLRPSGLFGGKRRG